MLTRCCYVGVSPTPTSKLPVAFKPKCGNSFITLKNCLPPWLLDDKHTRDLHQKPWVDPKQLVVLCSQCLNMRCSTYVHLRDYICYDEVHLTCDWSVNVSLHALTTWWQNSRSEVLLWVAGSASVRSNSLQEFCSIGGQTATRFPGNLVGMSRLSVTAFGC